MDQKQSEFGTTSVDDFRLIVNSPPPQGYPEHFTEDDYSKTPFELSYAKRKTNFIDFCLSNPGNSTVKGFFYELIRLSENKGPIHEGLIVAALDYIESRKDCSDFVLLGIMRLFIQFQDTALLNPLILERTKRTILNFKYWPDEPGNDSMCYWTENHYILFSVNEYLAGSLFPNQNFPNSGMTGQEKIEKAKPRIIRWLDMRFYTGFNEWLSNVYFDEDLTALLNLIDFSKDESLIQKGKIVTDLLLFSMLVNSYYGQFVSTHGRTYTKEKQSALIEATIDTQKLLFGMGKYSNKDNMSAVTLVLSQNYTFPQVLFEIARDFNRQEMLNRQRIGINIKDAKKWGVGFKGINDGMFLLTFEAYVHPKTINNMITMLDTFRWWSNRFFIEFSPFKSLMRFGRYIGITKLFAFITRKDLTRNTREENNIYTFRTPDYLLSSSQDYRKGYGGDQHHIWQGTLDVEAICFTTHPGGYKNISPEGYWHGSGFLPRTAQIKNVLISVYNIPRRGGILLSKVLPFTHAWFPKMKYDEVIEQNDWIFGRKGKGYLALRSQHSYRWQMEGKYANKEILVEGRKNVWIIEMGREEINGSFTNFMDSIIRAEIQFSGLNVVYNSPTQGTLHFGWSKHFTQNRKVIPLNKYPRYENPYCKSPFGSDTIKIEHQNSTLELNLKQLIRKESL